MAYTRFKEVVFGIGKTGLLTVGYQLFDASGSPVGSRTTTGVAERTTPGTYGATITFPDGFIGSVTWDTGELTPVFAEEERNPGSDERLDVKVSSINPFGSGANSVTITIQTTSFSPVQGAVVTIKNSGQTSTIGVGTTDINGQVVFNLDDGSYKVLITTSPIYSTLPAQTLTVSGTTTVTYTVTQTVIPSPSSPSLCRVFGFMIKPGGEVAAGVSVKFKIAATNPVIASGNFLDSTFVESVETDSTGFFQADLVQSALIVVTVAGDSQKYKMICTAAKLNKEITVPSASTADWITL